MSRVFTTRRSQWAPGLAVLGVAVGVGGLIGVSLGARSWPGYLGIVLAVLLLIGWLERVRLARPRRPPRPPTGTKLRLIPGGRSEYDLESDDSTNDQKYVM